jgi:hypothetical protein
LRACSSSSSSSSSSKIVTLEQICRSSKTRAHQQQQAGTYAVQILEYRYFCCRNDTSSIPTLTIAQRQPVHMLQAHLPAARTLLAHQRAGHCSMHGTVCCFLCTAKLCCAPTVKPCSCTRHRTSCYPLEASCAACCCCCCCNCTVQCSRAGRRSAVVAAMRMPRCCHMRSAAAFSLGAAAASSSSGGLMQQASTVCPQWCMADAWRTVASLYVRAAVAFILVICCMAMPAAGVGLLLCIGSQCCCTTSMLLQVNVRLDVHGSTALWARQQRTLVFRLKIIIMARRQPSALVLFGHPPFFMLPAAYSRRSGILQAQLMAFEPGLPHSRRPVAAVVLPLRQSLGRLTA